MCVQMLIHFAHEGFSWMVGMMVLLKEFYFIFYKINEYLFAEYLFYKKQVFSLSQANIIL